MKKLTFLLILSILLTTVSFSVFADNDYTVKTNVKSELIKDENIYKLSVYLTDIKDETGLAIIDYCIKYDPSVFKLKKADSVTPDLWKDHIDSEMAENLSNHSSGEYRWAWVMSLIGNGIKEDNQLVLNMEFEVLSESDTVVNVSAIAVANDNLKVVSANSVAIKINTEAGSEQIDPDAPAVKPSSSLTSNSYVSGSEGEDANNELQPSDNSPAQFFHTDNPSSDNLQGGNTALIVILSLIGVLAAATCIFVLMKKRS